MSHSDSMICSYHWRVIAQWQVKLFGYRGPVVAAEEVTEALIRIAELTGEEVESVFLTSFSKICIGK